MSSELNFIPRILLCGNEQEFFSRIGTRPFKIVGHFEIQGKVGKKEFNFKQDGRSFFNDKVHEFAELTEFLLSGKIDYIIFNKFPDFVIYRNYSLRRGALSTKCITIEQFKALPSDCFFEFNVENQIIFYLKEIGIKTLLDVDAYFSRGNVFTKLTNDLTEIDCICEKPLPPIMENIYTHVYKDFAQVGYKHYDAALIIERKPIDFDSMFNFLENTTDFVITFARTGSELEKRILAKLNNFEKVQGIRAETGQWLFLRRHRKPEDFCIYVVTYKDTKLAEPPEGYKIIHAGRALKEDIGYIGDNTGDNISHLNVYLNEITALYWMWKNTNHTVLGLAHYRRFLTESDDAKFSYDKILTKDAALKLLERYDIIVSMVGYEMMTQQELIKNDCGIELATFAEDVIKKHLLKVQPDYLQTFEDVMGSLSVYKCHLLIARRNIFDAYCKWLFSFYLDVTDEILRTVNLDELPFSPRRLIAFLAERMLTVWLRKNRLRIKELKFMFIEGI